MNRVGLHAVVAVCVCLRICPQARTAPPQPQAWAAHANVLLPAPSPWGTPASALAMRASRPSTRRALAAWGLCRPHATPRPPCASSHASPWCRWGTGPSQQPAQRLTPRRPPPLPSSWRRRTQMQLRPSAPCLPVRPPRQQQRGQLQQLSQARAQSAPLPLPLPRPLVRLLAPPRSAVDARRAAPSLPAIQASAGPRPAACRRGLGTRQDPAAPRAALPRRKVQAMWLQLAALRVRKEAWPRHGLPTAVALVPRRRRGTAGAACSRRRTSVPPPPPWAFPSKQLAVLSCVHAGHDATRRAALHCAALYCTVLHCGSAMHRAVQRS